MVVKVLNIVILVLMCSIAYFLGTINGVKLVYEEFDGNLLCYWLLGTHALCLMFFAIYVC